MKIMVILYVTVCRSVDGCLVFFIANFCIFVLSILQAKEYGNLLLLPTAVEAFV